jgi:hypothetical protein
MNAATTKRRDRRFRAYIPLRVTVNGHQRVLVPRDISASGCYFDYKDGEFRDDKCQVEIILDDGKPPLQFDATQSRREPGFKITWHGLDAEQSARLYAHLLNKSTEPSTYSKAAYIHWEQRNICVTLRDIEDRKHKAYTFLYGIVVAYFVYLCSPLHLFTISTPEQVGLYALCGIWISIIALYHSMRSFSWLGSINRQRAFLYHALETNRSWVFANDGSYYSKTVYPLGTRYDESRISPNDSRQRHALDIKYNWASPLFHCGIQALFAFGLVLFLSIGLCAVRDPQHIDKNFKEAVFANACFRTALVGLVGLPLCWLHFWGNTTSRYHKLTWEARRISAETPNPKFPENVLKIHLSPVQIGFTAAQVVVLACAILALILLAFNDSLLVNDHLRWAAALILPIYFLGKIASTMLQIWWMSSKRAKQELASQAARTPEELSL